VTGATHCNDGGKRALWMLAKRSKMSERSQCQDEGEQRPGDERRANSGGVLRDQPRTRTMCSAKEIKGHERMQGICMPERHHEPKLVFGQRGSRTQTISTSLCRRGSRNSSCVWPNRSEHEHRSLLLIREHNNTRSAKLKARE